jgi:hypothetical protein
MNKVVLAATLALALVAGGTSGSAAAASDIGTARDFIFAKTNEARAAQGLAPLTLSASLTAISQGCSERQAAADEMAHCLDYSTKYPDGWVFAAENVAAGFAYTAVVDGWMKSQGHRRNILSSATHIGIGIAVTADGTAYYTQNFGEYPTASDIDEVDATVTPVTGPVTVPTPETPVAPVVKTFTGVAKISGTATVGKKLTAKKYRYPAGTTFTYRWTAGGKNIAGATHSTLKLTKKLVGKHIRVRVTARFDGYAKASTTSAATNKVKR